MWQFDAQIFMYKGEVHPGITVKTKEITRMANAISPHPKKFLSKIMAQAKYGI